MDSTILLHVNCYAVGSLYINYVITGHTNIYTHIQLGNRALEQYESIQEFPLELCQRLIAF